MGFFDTVLEENTKAMTSSATTKKDEQDGSFLIIDDSVSAASIPDTAVQLFDATPVEDIQDPAPVSEISFFSEPAIQAEVSSVETTEPAEVVMEIPTVENAFFNEPEITSDSSSLSAPVESVEITSETVDVPFVLETSAMEVVPEKTTVAVTEEIIESHQKAGVSSPLKKIDFDAYIAEKNAELDQFIADNMKLAEVKDAEIVSYNAQIAEAKETEKQAIEMAKKIAKQAIDKARESAKKALDERKNIELENDRIKEIKGRLSIQA